VRVSPSWAGEVADRSTALAVELVKRGARLIVVGGTARWLRDGLRWPRDLDVVVPSREVPQLVTALAQIGVHISEATLLRRRDVALTSPWGPLDVFVRDRLPPAGPIHVGGCRLVVAHD
jgi:hypothetical protein